MPFARFTVHHNFEVERQFAGRVMIAFKIYKLNAFKSIVNKN
jgi:hypothetical protein